MRKERVRWYQQSADFVGVLRVMFSRLCGRVGVCAGKLFRKRLLFKLLAKRSTELRTYESACLTQNFAP